MANIFKKLLSNGKAQQEYEIVVATDPTSSYSESFRKLPIDIKFSTVDNEAKVIQVTSSIAGEHKTTTTINLGAVYVELGYKVVIVDCDLRKPKLHRATEILNEDGLTNYLIDKVDYKSLIKKTKYNMDIVNAGEQVPFPHVILRSEKFKQLITQLRLEYDYVILDSPPILLVTDSLIISEVADTTLFTINQKLTKKNESKEAIRLLKERNVKIAGIVISNASKNVTSYNKYDRYY